MGERPNRRPWRAAWMGAFGAALTVAGAVIALGDDLLVGVGAAFLGLAMLAALPTTIPVSRRELPEVAPADGTSEAALVFRYSGRAVRAGTVSMGLFAAVMAMLALWPDEIAPGEPFARPLGIVTALFLGGMFVIGLGNSLHGGCLALSPRGLRNGRPAFGLFVPWEAIEDVAATETRGIPLIGIFVSDRRSIGTTRLGRLLLRLDRGRSGDVTLSPAVFQVEPAWVLETIRHYVEHPADRQELGTPAAVERFVRIAWAAEESRA